MKLLLCTRWTILHLLWLSFTTALPLNIEDITDGILIRDRSNTTDLTLAGDFEHSETIDCGIGLLHQYKIRYYRGQQVLAYEQYQILYNLIEDLDSRGPYGTLDRLLLRPGITQSGNGVTADLYHSDWVPIYPFSTRSGADCLRKVAWDAIKSSKKYDQEQVYHDIYYQIRRVELNWRVGEGALRLSEVANNITKP